MKKRDKILIFIIYSLIIILGITLYIEMNRHYYIGIVTASDDDSFKFQYITEKIGKNDKRKSYSRGQKINVWYYEDSHKLEKFYAVKIYMKREALILESAPPSIKYGIKHVRTISKEEFDREVKKNALEIEFDVWGNVIEYDF